MTETESNGDSAVNVGGDNPSTGRARMVIGDVRDVLRAMPGESVDLVLTSPPFLALRSYLPPDHPDKAKEIGGEAGPGEFIDALLDVVEECRRVLKPKGSIAFELGDTYGSAKRRRKENGHAVRDDAPRPPRNGRRSRAQDEADGVLAPRGRPGPEGRDVMPGWPMDKSLCLIPELFRVALVYGFNPLTGRTTPRWRARNVVRWCRPNPPVGDPADKFRPGTSDMVIATLARDRYFDLDAVRTPGKEPERDRAFRYGTEKDHHAGAGPERQTFRNTNEAGVPPLDWWEIPTQPYKGSHYAVWPPALLVRPILAMCPAGGVVLDPFAGSGTTLMVATGHGRDAIGIDLDARNADLAARRVGMFLEIEHHEPVDKGANVA